MIHRYRTLLFLLFVSVFFITAGSVLFYAFGYRFSLERGIFIYTGSLSLKTTPDTVDIKIDGIITPKKRLGILNNSIHIPGLNPGEHFIEVSAPGYRPWSKKIVIQSGLSTEFWNILLVQENYEQITLPHTEKVQKMFQSPSGLLATVKKNENVYSVEVLDTDTEESIEVFRTNEAVFSPELRTNIEWSPESHKIVIPLTKNGRLSYAIVDIENKETVYLNDLAHTTTPLSLPRWDATSRDVLFFLEDTLLYRVDTSDPASSPILVQDNVAAYDISGNDIYYLSSENGLVYRTSPRGEAADRDQITPSPVTVKAESLYSLITYDKDRLIILDTTDGTLVVFNKKFTDNPLKKIGSGVKEVQYSDDGKKILFSTDNEIFVYFNQDWETQPIRAIDTTMQIARFSTPIRNVQWTKDYEHILFSLGNSIKMAELDNRDRRDLSDILTLETLPLQILSRFGEDSMYIVKEKVSDEGANSVVSVHLTPVTSLFGL